MKAQKGNVGMAIRRRELIMNHLNPTLDMLLQKEKEKKKSIHRNINLIGFCQSILCQYFAEIYPISSAIQRTSCCFFLLSQLSFPLLFFYCPYFQVFTLKPIVSKKKLIMGSSVMKII